MLRFIAKNIRYWVTNRRSSAEFVRWFNATNGVAWGLPVSLRYESTLGCMIADDGKSRIHFCRNSRVDRYQHGVEACLDKLAREYMINEIQFADGDCVVDCGANVGEVSLWLKQRYPQLKLILVEPEPMEANCADLNVFDGKAHTVRKALWKEEGTLSFYKKPEGADSSLFEVEDADEVVQVPVTTLANLLGEAGIGRVRLLKLEAEGAEPEILLGCGEGLSNIDYIAADCGPERGLSQDETATDLINYLLSRNFDLIDMKFDRVVCLFRNQSARL